MRRLSDPVIPFDRSSNGALSPACVLFGRRDLRSNNTWMHNLPVLAKGRERCTLLVHPDDVARFGLRDGGTARVTNPHTNESVTVVVVTDDAMRPGVVSLPHSWGHDAPAARLNIAKLRPGVNANYLVDPDRRDPLSGNAAFQRHPSTRRVRRMIASAFRGRIGSTNQRPLDLEIG